jgi:hypothetical protein
MNADRFAGHTTGPRAITTTRNSCAGCPALELEEWKDYLENDGTDSGTSARCAIANKSITAYWNDRYAVPEFCKCPALTQLTAPELLAENERIKHELAAALFDNERLRGEVKMHEIADYDAYLAAQLGGAYP